MSRPYLRYPDVCGDLLAFVADDDVWIADLTGDSPRRVSNDHVRVANPRLSPDGSKLAWTSWRAGTADVYVCDLSTKITSRLTWWGERTLSVGWHGDGRVVVASSTREVTLGLMRLYLVSMDGTAQKLPLGPAASAAWNPEGLMALSTPNYRDSAFWKRYRGGTAGKTWIEQTGGGWAKAASGEPAGMYSPGWHSNRVFFSSDLGAGAFEITDPQAQAQLYSVDRFGGDLRQHTHHGLQQGYVRDPRSDGRTIVYHAHGRLYAMDGLDDPSPRVIELDLGIGGPAPLVLRPTDGLEQVRPDWTGAGSLMSWYGSVYHLAHHHGPARVLLAEDGVRVREPIVLGNTGLCAYVVGHGVDEIEVAHLDGLGDKRRLTPADDSLGYVLHMVASPDGSMIAVSSHDGKIWLVDVADGAMRLVDDGHQGEVWALAWSPDSRYLAWSAPLASAVEDGKAQLRCVDTSQPGTLTWEALTSGAYRDAEPVFTLDGTHLAWISWRTFDPQMSPHGFDMSFADASRVWIAPLRPSDQLPFDPGVDGWSWTKAETSESSSTPASNESSATGPVDAVGFEARAAGFPIPSGRYMNLRAVKGGLVWLRDPGVEGDLGTARSGVPGEKPAKLVEYYCFESRKVEVLVDNADSFEVNGVGDILVVRTGDDVIAQPVRRISDDDADARVQVDLTRLRRSVDRRAWWHQMFDENGRLMALHFWRDDMDGVDWSAVLDRYRPLIDHCLTSDDVYDVLYESVAELNTSHAYVIPQPPSPSSWATGFLGVEVTKVDSGFRVDRLLPGLSSDPNAWQPMGRAGVVPGDVIEAIDGRRCGAARSLGACLEGAVGKPVELVVRTADEAPRRVAVVPLPSESALRYHDWVAARAARVEKVSGGRVGYLHVPNMSALGWAQVERMIDLASRHEAVIADVRYNGGGFISQLVIERLARRTVGWSFGRWVAPVPYPGQGMRGPVVVLTNEHAGSDGDIVTAVAKLHGLTVVGVRTWGGVIGIDGRYHLVDGTEVTQPRYASWFTDVGFGIENYGVDPDIEVPLTPDQWQSEDDRQLDVAVDEALRQLGHAPAMVPPQFLPPRFAAR